MLLVPSTRAMISWASCKTVISDGLPRFTGSEKSVFRSRYDALDQVGDVAEAAGLFAFAVDGDRLAAQGLAHEVGQNPAVVEPHPRAVGVEDPDDPRVDAVEAVIGHGDGFGKPLGLIVDSPRRRSG